MGEGADEAEAVREDVRVEEGRRAVGEVTQKVAGEATQRVPRALGEAGKVVDEADVKGASEQAVEEWGAARNPKSGQNQLLAVFHGSMQNVDRSYRKCSQKLNGCAPKETLRALPQTFIVQGNE